MHVVSREAGRSIAGKRVLVTGAGGSIGSELCRQVQRVRAGRAGHARPRRVEPARARSWRSPGQGCSTPTRLVVADIRDRDALYQVFREHRPEIVFHAAALKHLPLLERHPCEGVKTNVLGTAEPGRRRRARTASSGFVLISTDKAADPARVLGATKRLAELAASGGHRARHRAGLGALRQRAGLARVAAARVRPQIAAGGRSRSPTPTSPGSS